MSQAPDDARRAAGNRRSLLFAAKFLGLLALFYIPVTLEAVDRGVIEPFTRGIALVSGLVLNALGQHVTIHGVTLITSGAAVIIRNGCNGVEATVFLVAATLAFPAPWRHRLLGVLGGIALIQLLNLIRVVTLVLLRIHKPELFELFHLAIWQTIIAGSTIGFFYLWTTRAAAAAPSHDVAHGG
jgi:exosortase H (IPTLxxWG-CTERM-specific)